MIETQTHVYFLYSKCYLSNFYPSEYTLNGITFCCVEQGYQYEKALHFGDTETANEILLARNPYDHKRLGRSVRGFDESLWVGEPSIRAMITHVYAKFSHNRELIDEILLTSNKIIVESSNKDTFWGCGIRIDDPLLFDSNNWTGKNMLGKVLMRVRELLRLEKDWFF